jgi:DNA-binding response OmpR family regulator
MQTPRVLVVEDDPAICILLKALLNRRGYGCHVVHDGNEAMRHLRTQTYSAILLDLMLPGAFGFDVIRFVRAERPWMADRIIVATAACAATLRDFDASTVRALVRKPFDIQELVKHVDECVALDKVAIARASCASPI